MEFAEAYAKLDLNELSKLISADVSLEPFREIMEFDRSLNALGTLTLIPVNSVAVQNRFEIKIRVNLSLDGEIYSHVNTYYLSYEREGSKRFATDLELVGLRSQAEDLLDGLDAYIEALGSGDFVRAVALTDMSEASSSAREETIAQLYRLTVVDPRRDFAQEQAAERRRFSARPLGDRGD